MPTLDEKQTETAQEITRQVKSLRSDQGAALATQRGSWLGQDNGLTPCCRATSIGEIIPIFVSAPAGEMDSGPIALLETARQLKANGLLNGEMSLITDPEQRWREKMTAITEAVDRNHEAVVLLCDEPTHWYRFQESLVDDSSDYCARSLAEWMVNRAECRRIAAGWIPNDRPAGRIWAPRLDDGRELLAVENDLAPAFGMRLPVTGTLPDPLPDRSAWEMKLCVAYPLLLPPTEVAHCRCPRPGKSVLERLFDQIESRPEYEDFGWSLAQLALARTDLDEGVLEDFTSGLEPLQRGPDREMLLDWDGAGPRASSGSREVFARVPATRYRGETHSAMAAIEVRPHRDS